MQPFDKEVEKYGKLLIFSYVKGVNQQEHEQYQVGENKEQGVCTTTVAHSMKEDTMEACHKALCGHVVVGNGVNCV